MDPIIRTLCQDVGKVKREGSEHGKYPEAISTEL